MHETQRLGQEIEQEPVAWLLTDKKINSLQVDDIQRLIDRLKHAHHTDLCVRINGQDEWFEADWLKHMVRASPPQPEQEPVAWIERDMQCDDFDPDSVTCEKPTIAADGWEWVALYTTPPQRKPLTDKAITKVIDSMPKKMKGFGVDWDLYEFARAIEAKPQENT